MTQPETHLRATLLGFLALAFLSLAIWKLTQGNALEAAGHSLVATLAVLAALLVNDPHRPRTTQLRLFVTAMVLVPITLGIFIASLFF
ncbi:MAG TPA: hypothetical protein H9871_06940 [Candidatus Nesterenkonia stercoripullorum]|uniref:Uncharacterized protein n=1 Tax=Candidatus Nesterenkonia stercoripullorum TaxID=2838701 RepID=A0A9D1UT18_9MICC|nr:hypothetical protein [Candidatus Nesterenkonia stercoripullorum]